MTDIFPLFDNELIDFAHGKITGNHIFNLSLPDAILQKCGFPAQQRIEPSSSRLVLKAEQGNHPFDIVDIIGLDKALQKPIAVFEYGNKKEIQVLIAQQRTNLADVNNKEAGSASDSYYLDSVDSILQSFKNVNDIFPKDFPHYAEYKERYKIFQRFRECYQKTESLDVYLAKP